MIARFVRFLIFFNAILVIGVLVFLHYGIARMGNSNPTNISAWMQLVNWSFNLVLFLFYLLLVALVIIFMTYVRRAKK